jgi:uncharacterized membrane protein
MPADLAPPHRIVAVDILRGIAIFVMIPANMAASIYAEPHAFWFRVISSFAAPMFVTIAGMMTVAGKSASGNTWKHYLERGGLLLAVAAMIDVVIWKVIPFHSFDVLYLIGIACPITYFFVRVGRGWQLGIVAAIFVLTPILQWKFGYTNVPAETYLWGSHAGQHETVAANPTGTIQHLFIDGYFPIFPWLGMSLTGAVIAALFFDSRANHRQLGLATVALLVVGIAVWLFDPGQQYVRDDYSELFYPPTIGFVLTSLGVLLALLFATHWTSHWRIYVPFRWLGECALLMYILHLAIIAYFLEPSFDDLNLAEFMIVNFLTVLVLLGIAAAVHYWKFTWTRRPYVLRFLLGG